MKSITSKLSIIILSLLASTHTFAFNSEQVCAAMNEAVTSTPSIGNTFDLPIFWGPITNIYSRETSSMDSRGEVIGNVGGYPDRIEGQSGLECSGDTCHVNKKWPDCECTSSACAKDKYTAISNCNSIQHNNTDDGCSCKKQQGKLICSDDTNSIK